MDSKILLVDDEKDIADLIEEVLRQDSFENIKKVYTGMDAVQVCREYQPDVVVLDIMLPDIDGIEVCKQIREFSFCSILFLSSKNDDIDKILGLSCGGDDYITKPFVPLEAVARIHSNLRRFYDLGSGKISAPENDILETKSLRLDLKSCLLYRRNEKIVLTSVEFRIMKLFMENPGKVFTKQQLFEQGWGESYMLSDNNVMVCISKLRAKLDHDNTEYIRTIRGLGYRLEDEGN